MYPVAQSHGETERHGPRYAYADREPNSVTHTDAYTTADSESDP